MAGWDHGCDNDDDVLNLNLFARKSFGFQGIPREKENVLRKIVTHIGASCDDYPKYIFTSIEHYNSLTDISTALYNVTYIRDCVDANRCLTIEHYKFGPKYSEKKEYREFDPCCANFHNGNDACLICDPTLKTEAAMLKKTAKRTRKSSLVSETSAKKTKKKHSIQNLSVTKQDSTSADSNSNNLRRPHWDTWEDRMVLDYLICNDLIKYAKGPTVYRRMSSEGYLKHRSADSMRVHFRIKILKNIESYNLPAVVLKEFKKLKKSHYSTSRLSATGPKKLQELKKKRMRLSAKES